MTVTFTHIHTRVKYGAAVPLHLSKDACSFRLPWTSVPCCWLAYRTSCEEDEREPVHAQSSVDCDESVVKLSEVHAEIGHLVTELVRTWYWERWSAVEAGVDSVESHCDMHVHRRVGFLSFSLLSRPLLPAVSSPLLFDSGTKSWLGSLWVSDIRQILLSLQPRDTFAGEIFSPELLAVC